ncbi:hypothetical protein RB195_002081 [Necator americanus]|uniref:Uncharacterized protein n=1 Tax=Necator americanus TaxID=51031 RepID=A0ABR1DHA0_NECAM
MPRLRDPAEYVSKAKHRWAGHIMRRIDDRWTKRTLEWIPRGAKRSRGRPPTRWGDVFATRMDQLRAQLDTAQGPRQCRSRSLRTSWMTMGKQESKDFIVFILNAPVLHLENIQTSHLSTPSIPM